MAESESDGTGGPLHTRHVLWYAPHKHTQKNKHKKYQRKEKVGDVLQVTRTIRSRELRSVTPRSQPAEPRLGK